MTATKSAERAATTGSIPTCRWVAPISSASSFERDRVSSPGMALAWRERGAVRYGAALSERVV